MHWLLDAMWARIGWALGELVIAVIVLAVILIVVLIAAALTARKQARCSHSREGAYGAGGTEIRCVECKKFLRHAWQQKPIGN